MATGEAQRELRSLKPANGERTPSVSSFKSGWSLCAIDSPLPFCRRRPSRLLKYSNLTHKEEPNCGLESMEDSIAVKEEMSASLKLTKSKSSRRVGDFMEEDALSTILDSPKADLSSAEKLEWLRGQLIGDKLEFVTPFGKRQLLYVDHTASGRSLVFIEKFIVQYVLPFYGNTHTEDSFVGRRTTSMVRKSAKYIKRCLGGTSNDALLFCGSGCTGALKRLQEVMGIAVPSTLRSQVLDNMMEEERWVVFTGPYEHHSNLLSWRQSLAEVVEIPADEEGFIDLVALETALESPLYQRRRKLGSFSACSNVTGLITDTRAIARLLHRHGAFACFDFAASAPHVQIDMRSSDKDGYDAVVLSPHKFMGGPNTPGVLLMRKSLYMLGKCPPSTCGGGTVSYVNGFNEEDTLYVKHIEEREDGGTPQIVQKIRCALVFWVKDFIGTSVVEQRESFFIKKAITRLSDNPKIKLLGNIAAKRAPVLSFLVFSTSKESSAFHLSACVTQGKPLHGRFVVKLLNDLFGIQARGGCACAGPYGHLLLGVGRNQSLKLRSAIKRGYEGLKPGWARLSFSYDMTDEEVEYVLAAIEMIAKYGQRFLPLYDFDWKTGDWTFKDLKGLTYEEEQVSSLNLRYGDIEVQHKKFAHCLREAKTVAHMLPKSPAPRVLPGDIMDADMLLFRV
ncbi:hypothetical protein GOP47_0022621 [Adiantum capillus-veneris]|uniref:Aminotransferase class V domain-containing protein n=1 Tax=Adiantum capillus-veneris TaxID=13818 RepID=A0A9D4U6U2_ADICA|nr:hypothetical protein GOP47_0022621 [Adiantum capillus-veneris]